MKNELNLDTYLLSEMHVTKKIILDDITILDICKIKKDDFVQLRNHLTFSIV